MRLLTYILMLHMLMQCLFQVIAYAEEYTGIQLSGSQGTVLTTLNVDNLHSKKQQINVKRRKLILAFNTGDDHLLGSTYNFEVNLKFKLTMKDVSGQILNEVSPLVLDINNTQPEDVAVIEFHSLETVQDLEIFILNSGYTLQPAGDAAFINQHIKLTVGLEDKLGYGVFNERNDYIIPTNLEVWPCSGCTADNLSKVTFKWGLPEGLTSQHFDSYDLDLLKVEPGEDGSVVVDWNKASTLEVYTNSYTMTLAEGTGFYLWRVRGIGSYYPSGRSDARNLGQWSSHIDQGTITNLYNSDPSQPNKASIEMNPVGVLPNTVSNNYFYYNQFDEDVNWIYNKVLTEDSRQSETMTYANGLNQVNQVQTKLFSSNTVLATQNVYDYGGRASLQSLVAPTGDNKLGFKSSFFKDITNNVYSASNFDQNSKIYQPDGLASSIGTPNHYYSNNNNSVGTMGAYVPNAGGFPYTRTLYYNDPTGRIYKQSGAGDTMRLRAQNSHNIMYSYSGVTQDELDLIFGSEAPLAQTVYKKITLDPNNVSTVSYINNPGQLLATALSQGVQTPALDNIGNERTTTVTDVLEPGIFAEGSLVSRTSKSIVIDEPLRTINLDYKLTPKIFTIECSGDPSVADICLTCDYRVEIEIVYPEDPPATGRYFKLAFDIPASQLASCVEQGALVLGTNTIPQVQYWDQMGGASQNKPFDDAAIKSVTLEKGTYIVEKRVYVKNNDPGTGLSYLGNYLDQYRSRSSNWTLDNNCCGPEPIDTSFYDCDETSLYCEDTVGDEFAGPGGDEQLANDIYQVIDKEQTHEYETPEGIIKYKEDRLKNHGSYLLSNTYYNASDPVSDIQNLLTTLIQEEYINCDNLSDCFYISKGMLDQNIVVAGLPASQPMQPLDEQGMPNVDNQDTDIDADNPTISYYNDEFDFIKTFQECLGYPKSECEQFEEIITWHIDDEPPGIPSGALIHPDLTAKTLYIKVPKRGYAEADGDPDIEKLSQNELCIRAYFNDNLTQNVEWMELQNYNSVLVSSKEEAIVKVCECIDKVTQGTDEPPDISTEEIVTRFESECKDVCDSKRVMFEYEIDKYVAEQNHKNGVYTQDQVDSNGNFLWKGYDQFFSGMDKSCLLDIMVNQCKSQCDLSVRRNVDQNKLEDPSNNLEYLEYIQSDEFKEALEKEQLRYEQAFMQNAEVAPVGSYINAPDLETAQKQTIDFIYTSLEEGLINRKKTAYYQEQPPSQYPLTLNFISDEGNLPVPYEPDKLVYNQQVQTIMYPIGNAYEVDEETIFKEVTVVVNTIWDEQTEVDDMLHGDERYRTADDRVLQYDISLYCGNNRIAYYSQFARALIAQNGNQLNCYLSSLEPYNHSLYPEINNPYSVIGIERDMLDIYFDTAQMLHIIPARSNCEDSVERVNGQGIIFENISPYHTLRVFSFELADVDEAKSLLVEIDESGTKKLLYQAPISIDSSNSITISNEQKVVDAINNSTEGHRYKAYLGDPHLDNPSGTEIFIVLNAKDTRENPSQYYIEFVVDADTNVNDVVQNQVSRNYVMLTPMEALISECTDVQPETAICPYLLDPLDSIPSIKFGYLYLLGKEYTPFLEIDDYHENADAALSKEEALLTPEQPLKRGSIWNKEKIDLDEPFEMEFEVFLGDSDEGGDGIAFVLHNDIRGLLALGGYGAGLGYGSMSWSWVNRIRPSLAIEIDTFQNDFEISIGESVFKKHVTGDHIAVIKHGRYYGTPLAGPVKARLDGANIEDDEVHTVKLIWSGHPSNKLEVFFDGKLRLNLTKDIKYDIFSGENVWWGWTGATSNNASNKQWIKPLLQTDPCEPCEICMRWYEIPSADEILTNLGDFPPVQEYTCEGLREEYVNNETDYYLEQCLESKLQEIETTYEDSCLNNIDDEFKISYVLGYHHYALYYYDRAGNIIKTIPPQGIDFLNSSEIGQVQDHRAGVSGQTPVYPTHNLATNYSYNSIKQLISQITPDGGETKFWYNANGQQLLIQDAVQATTGEYSYLKYDELGRVIESGELENFTPTLTDNEQQIIQELWDNIDFPDGITPPPLPSLVKRETTYTVYSQPASGEIYAGRKQQHLRNRISHSWRDDDGDPGTVNDQYYTYYSYDPHGNLEWLVQQLPEIGKKTVRYEYDLVSSNVDSVIYQEKTSEQFMHRYEYDEDNRITAVYTSKDGIVWDKDVGYSYYLHGPLARTEIGEDKIQGVDYVYTIESYLKSINQVQLLPNNDPGGDGATPDGFLKDEFAMELGYYQGDYNRSGTKIGSNNTTVPYAPANQGLYNGNISSWATNLRSGNSTISGNPLGLKMNLYRYDKLNRLKSGNFKNYDPGTSAWADPGNAYDENFSYDANGNILTVNRYGWPGYGRRGDQKIDELTYHINTPTTNRLMYIDDAIGLVNSANPDSSDLPDHSPANYQYDMEGKLTTDVSEGLSIAWNVLDKVKEVINTKTQKKIKFGYNSLGHRVIKKIFDLQNDKEEKTTFYIRDIQGLILAIYSKQEEDVDLPRGGSIRKFVYRLSEIPLYGSDRLGVFRPNLEVKIDTASESLMGETALIETESRLRSFGAACDPDIHSELRTWLVATGPAANKNSGAHMLMSYGQTSIVNGEATDNLIENDLYMGKNVAVAEDENRQKVFEFFVTNKAENPEQINGLLGKYYDNENLSGFPKVLRSDAVIDFSWNSASPMPGVLGDDNFSIRWDGEINVAESGGYDFLVRSDSPTRLWIANTNVIDKWDESDSTKNLIGSAVLREGVHPIKVEFSDQSGDASIELRWRKIEWNEIPPDNITVDNVYNCGYWGYPKKCAEGKLVIETADYYRILAYSDEFEKAKLDGNNVSITAMPNSRGSFIGPVYLEQGEHNFKFEFGRDDYSENFFWDGGLIFESRLVGTNYLSHNSPDVSWLLNARGASIDEYHEVRAHRDYSSIIVKATGSDSDKYFLITGKDGKLYYHTIHANPYSAILTKKYDPLTLTTGQELQYGGVVNPYILAAYNDLYHADSNVLYVTMNRGGSVELYEFNVDTTGIGQGTLLHTFTNPIACTACTDIGEMQISPNGDSLSLTYTVFDGSIYTHKLAIYNFNTGSISRTIDIGTETYSGTGQGVSLKLRHRIMSFDYSPNATYLYYAKQNCPTDVIMCYGNSQKPAELMRLNLERASPTSEKVIDINLQSFQASVRRGADGKLYLNYVDSSNPDQSFLKVFSKLDDGNVNEVMNSQGILLLGKGKNRFGLPLQPYLTNSECRERDKGFLSERGVGKKLYEFTDHLNNVRTVLSDERKATISGGTITASKPEVKAYLDYYAFGALMPERNFSSNGYGFGFNSFESDDEVKGANNSYYTHARLYDPRVGRWLSPDPAGFIDDFNVYAFVKNNPIRYIDPKGMDMLDVIEIETATALFGSREEAERQVRHNTQLLEEREKWAGPEPRWGYDEWVVRRAQQIKHNLEVAQLGVAAFKRQEKVLAQRKARVEEERAATDRENKRTPAEARLDAEHELRGKYVEVFVYMTNIQILGSEDISDLTPLAEALQAEVAKKVERATKNPSKATTSALLQTSASGQAAGVDYDPIEAYRTYKRRVEWAGGKLTEYEKELWQPISDLAETYE